MIFVIVHIYQHIINLCSGFNFSPDFGFRIIPDSQNPVGIPDFRNSCCIPSLRACFSIGKGNGLAVQSWPRNPEVRGSIPHLGSRRLSLIIIEHAELLRSTPSLELCSAWLVTMALHVHCGLGQLSPLPTSGDEK